MKLNLKKTMMLTFDLCLIFKLMSSFSDDSVSSVAYGGYILSVAFMVLVTFFKYVNKNHIAFERKKLLFCIQFFVVIILYGTVFANANLSEEIGQHIQAMSLFYTAGICAVTWINSKVEFRKMMKHAFFSLGVVTMFAFVIYNDGFEFVAHISDLFMRDSRYRWEYGFYHANFVGNLCLCILLLSLLIRKTNESYRKYEIIKSIPYFCIDLIAVMMLVASASRSNIIGLVIFGLIYIFLNISNWLPMSKNLTKFIQGLIIFIIVICIILSSDSNTFDILFKMSNRSLNFTINIPSLFASGRVLTGLGYVDAGMFGANRLPVSTWYVDNSYLYVFLTMGLFGFCWFLWVLIKLLLKVIKHDKMMNNGHIFTCVFVTYLVLGLSETCIFYPTFVTSIVYFSIFVSYAYLKTINQ